jgi:hypothetical protein
MIAMQALIETARPVAAAGFSRRLRLMEQYVVGPQTQPGQDRPAVVLLQHLALDEGLIINWLRWHHAHRVSSAMTACGNVPFGEVFARLPFVSARAGMCSVIRNLKPNPASSH